MMDQPHVGRKRDDGSSFTRDNPRTKITKLSPCGRREGASNIPPASICARELITLEAGSGSLRVSTDDTDQLIAAMVSATAPALSIGAPPRLTSSLSVGSQNY